MLEDSTQQGGSPPQPINLNPLKQEVGQAVSPVKPIGLNLTITGKKTGDGLRAKFKLDGSKEAKHPKNCEALILTSMNNDGCSDHPPQVMPNAPKTNNNFFSATFAEALTTFKFVRVFLMDEPNWLNEIDPESWQQFSLHEDIWKRCCELSQIEKLSVFQPNATESTLQKKTELIEELWQDLEAKLLPQLNPELQSVFAKHQAKSIKEKIAILANLTLQFSKSIKEKFIKKALANRDENWWPKNEGVFLKTLALTPDKLKQDNYTAKTVAEKIDYINDVAAKQQQNFCIDTWSTKTKNKFEDSEIPEDFLKKNEAELESTGQEFVKRHVSSDPEYNKQLLARSKLYLAMETFVLCKDAPAYLLYPGEALPAFLAGFRFFNNPCIWGITSFVRYRVVRVRSPAALIKSPTTSPALTAISTVNKIALAHFENILNNPKKEDLTAALTSFLQVELKFHSLINQFTTLIKALFATTNLDIKEKQELLNNIINRINEINKKESLILSLSNQSYELDLIDGLIQGLSLATNLSGEEIKAILISSINKILNPTGKLTTKELAATWQDKIEPLVFSDTFFKLKFFNKKARREVMRGIVGENFKYSNKNTGSAILPFFPIPTDTATFTLSNPRTLNKTSNSKEEFFPEPHSSGSETDRQFDSKY